MSRTLSPRARWGLVVAVGLLVLAAVDIWWIASHRHGYPLNIDEAGYTSIGLVDYLGFRNGGLHGWWEAVQTQTPNAPLVPALTSVLLLVKAGVMEGFGTLLAFWILLGFASYGVGERLAGPRLGALAAMLVALSPGSFLFGREYVFALPAAALLACSVYALLRSEGLQVRRWAVACGVALGLMLLTRTMTVAFVPGVLLAAVVALLLRRQQGSLSRGTLNLGLLLLSGGAVAATWYVRNLQPVLDYLTGFGYGEQADLYGENPFLSWGRMRRVAEKVAADDLLLPLALLVLAGLVAIAVVAIRRVAAAEDRRATLARLAGSDAFAVALVFACGYAALTSSRNGGEGFTFPLAVLLPPLAVIALRLYRSVAVPAIALLTLITALNFVAAANVSDGVSRVRLVSVPGFEPLPWLGGRPRSVSAVRDQVPGPATRFVDQDRGWPDADEALAQFLVEDLGTPTVTPTTAFASRNHVLNTNTVLLAGLLMYRRGLPLTQLNAEEGDTVAAYKRQLSDPRFGSPTALVTMSRNTDDFPPLVTQKRVEIAARQLHFRPLHTMTLPDDRKLRVWSQLP
jgi:hypothetical protein